MNNVQYESQLHLQLEILRRTELRPYTQKVIATHMSREEFIKFTKKFIEISKDNKSWDETIIIGDFKGVRYNIIKLIKYEQLESATR